MLAGQQGTDGIVIADAIVGHHVAKDRERGWVEVSVARVRGGAEHAIHPRTLLIDEAFAEIVVQPLVEHAGGVAARVPRIPPEVPGEPVHAAGTLGLIAVENDAVALRVKLDGRAGVTEMIACDDNLRPSYTDHDE